jgi:large subunit ribosomal protein L10
MNKDQKIAITSEIKELMDASGALYLTDFKGMTVAEANELRDEFYKANIKYRVVKNTLALRAIQDSGKYSEHSEKFTNFLKGETGLIFAGDDPVAPAKIIKKFFEKGEKPKLKVALVENEMYEAKQLNELASLLSKNELIAGILGSLDSPVSGLVGTLNAVIRDLASVIEEVGKKKQ